MTELYYKLNDFEGPLDLLLHLISKNKMDILDISIETLVEQYLGHIEKMSKSNMEIASEFIQMASRLIYLKTVSLLPKSKEASELKKELQGQLIEYKKCKEVAKVFKKIISFDSFCRQQQQVDIPCEYTAKIDIIKLCRAYANIILGDKEISEDNSAQIFSNLVKRKIISVQSKEIDILRFMYQKEQADYLSIFSECLNKAELVATFLALLELIKDNRICIYNDDIDFSNPMLKLNVGGESLE